MRAVAAGVTVTLAALVRGGMECADAAPLYDEGDAPQWCAPRGPASPPHGGNMGFRAALGTGPLDPGPTFAAPDRDRLQATIDRAAAHHDAHLAKYVVACLEAAAIDPAGAGQHLAAAVALDDWWARAEPVS